MRKASPKRQDGPRKPRNALPRLGKRGKQWEATRAKLKVRFERAGITDCELCGSNFALGFAHRAPRRNITTQDELKTVALLCASCHDATDNRGHRVMHDTVTRIIESREVQP